MKLPNCRGFANSATVPAKKTHYAGRAPPWELAKRASGVLLVVAFFTVFVSTVEGLGLFLFVSCLDVGLGGTAGGSMRRALLDCAGGGGYVAFGSAKALLFLLRSVSSIVMSLSV